VPFRRVGATEMLTMCQIPWWLPRSRTLHSVLTFVLAWSISRPMDGGERIKTGLHIRIVNESILYIVYHAGGFHLKADRYMAKTTHLGHHV
jgi:hypothetical protein